MTTLFNKLTGSTNILVNSIAAIFLTAVLCLLLSFIVLAVINGIKPF